MQVSEKQKKTFILGLRAWYRKNKRDFPWRNNPDPYAVLIAEVLLQKTNAPKVVSVYKKIIKKYPDPKKISIAKNQEVRNILKNLGLNYRAERLVSIGRTICEYHKCIIPNDYDELIRIKGLGRYISSAVLCFAYNKRVPIVDSNVIRIFERVFGLKSIKKRAREDIQIWEFADALLPSRKIKEYNYALLDFSALICTYTNPKHEVCPIRNICEYYKRINP